MCVCVCACLLLIMCISFSSLLIFMSCALCLWIIYKVRRLLHNPFYFGSFLLLQATAWYLYFLYSLYIYFGYSMYFSISMSAYTFMILIAWGRVSPGINLSGLHDSRFVSIPQRTMQEYNSQCRHLQFRH